MFEQLLMKGKQYLFSDDVANIKRVDLVSKFV